MTHHIPLAVPDLRGREAEYLQKCVEDNWVSSAGPYVTKFEEDLAALTGRSFGVAVCNGTAGLELALRVTGVGNGDLVMVPDYTFAASVNAIVHTGATPLFVDVEPESWMLSERTLRLALEKADRKPKALIVVQAHGEVADMAPIQAFAAEQDMVLVEDAAGAMGARYDGRPAGALGDLSVFSFNGNKTVTAGGGGVVLTDNAEWAGRIRHLSTQARCGEVYEHDAVGFNYRMTNLNAAVGLAQLERLDEMVTRKREIAARYDAVIAGSNLLVPAPKPAWSEGAAWLYSVVCPDAGVADDLLKHLRDANIGARSFWQSLHAQAPYAAFPAADCPGSEALTGRVVTLPCSSGLEAADLDRVCQVLESWMTQAGDA